MAAFTESAILRLIDGTSGPAKKMNAELNKLFATANKLDRKHIKIHVSLTGTKQVLYDTARIDKAVKKLSSKSAAIKITTAGMSKAVSDVQKLSRNLAMTRVNGTLKINSAAVDRAQKKMDRLTASVRAGATGTVNLPTTGGAVQGRPAGTTGGATGGGGYRRGGGNIGSMAKSTLGFAGLYDAYGALTSAIRYGFEQAKEGSNQAAQTRVFNYTPAQTKLITDAVLGANKGNLITSNLATRESANNLLNAGASPEALATLVKASVQSSQAITQRFGTETATSFTEAVTKMADSVNGLGGDGKFGAALFEAMARTKLAGGKDFNTKEVRTALRNSGVANTMDAKAIVKFAMVVDALGLKAGHAVRQTAQSLLSETLDKKQKAKLESFGLRGNSYSAESARLAYQEDPASFATSPAMMAVYAKLGANDSVNQLRSGTGKDGKPLTKAEQAKLMSRLTHDLVTKVGFTTNGAQFMAMSITNDKAMLSALKLQAQQSLDAVTSGLDKSFTAAGVAVREQFGNVFSSQVAPLLDKLAAPVLVDLAKNLNALANGEVTPGAVKGTIGGLAVGTAAWALANPGASAQIVAGTRLSSAAGKLSVAAGRLGAAGGKTGGAVPGGGRNRGAGRGGRAGRGGAIGGLISVGESLITGEDIDPKRVGGAIAGGIIGGFVGGPYGAIIGGQIGDAIGPALASLAVDAIKNIDVIAIAERMNKWRNDPNNVVRRNGRRAVEGVKTGVSNFVQYTEDSATNTRRNQLKNRIADTRKQIAEKQQANLEKQYRLAEFYKDKPNQGKQFKLRLAAFQEAFRQIEVDANNQIEKLTTEMAQVQIDLAKKRAYPDEGRRLTKEPAANQTTYPNYIPLPEARPLPTTGTVDEYGQRIRAAGGDAAKTVEAAGGVVNSGISEALINGGTSAANIIANAIRNAVSGININVSTNGQASGSGAPTGRNALARSGRTNGF